MYMYICTRASRTFMYVYIVHVLCTLATDDTHELPYIPCIICTIHVAILIIHELPYILYMHT